MLSTRRVRFRLPAGAGNATTQWNTREVLQVAVHPPGEPTVRGEAAPLPGYSQEALATAEQALTALVPRLPCLLRLEQVAELAPAVQRLPAPPSARYALELALLQRLSRIQNRPVWWLLADAAHRSPQATSALARLPPRAAGSPACPQPCALVSHSSTEAALEQAARLFARGTRCFKLKLGPESPTSAQMLTLRSLRNTYGSAIELRADANRSFKLGLDLHGLEAVYLQFLEEPFTEPSSTNCPLPLALDETLAEAPPERVQSLLRSCALEAVVLKPTRLGGLSASMVWAQRAFGCGAHAIASHTFEGVVGFWGCQQLALALAALGEAWAPGTGSYPRSPSL